MTAGCTNSATEPGGRAAGAVPAALLLAALASLATSPPAPTASRPVPASSAEALRQLLGKADKALAKAEGATRGKDAGRVSTWLIRAEEILADLQAQSGLEALDRSLVAARAAASEGDVATAAGAVERARAILPRLTDLTVMRQAEEASRAALTAAGEGDAAACLEAVRRCEAGVLAPVLLARILDARAAVQQGRGAMVRRDMKAGAASVAAARAALDALRAAGALSRARFALEIGAELLEQKATIAARDQLQKGLRDLDQAIEIGPEDRRARLGPARESVATIWKRVARPLAGDAPALRDAAGVIESVRAAQR